MVDQPTPQLVDKAALLAAPEEDLVDVEISDFGIVRIRPLTRAEALRFSAVGEEKGIALLEAEMIATAIVEPPFSIEEVKRWQKVSPAGDMEHLTDEINRISGMGPGAGKAATKSVPDEPDA